jgi:hypothetical protein
VKKILSLSIASLLLFCLANVAFCADFRNVNWGMSKEEVASNEDARLIKTKRSDDTLNYTLQAFGYSTASLRYDFSEGKLIASSYGFITPAKGTSRSVFDLYKNLKMSLIEKYGSPFNDEEIWANETYKQWPANMDAHIERGHVTYKTIWELEKTVIILDCKQLKSLGVLLPNTSLNYYEKSHYQSLQQPKLNSDLKNL